MFKQELIESIQKTELESKGASPLIFSLTDRKPKEISVIKGGIRFCLELITNDNKSRWLNYSTKENTDNPNGGNNYFKRTIEIALTNEIEIWVAYAKRDKSDADIEIFVTVRTQKDVPITIHNGISRSRVNKIPGLSIPLHCFAGAAMCQLYPEKQYMYVAPIADMVNIMFKKMPPNSLWLKNCSKEKNDSLKKQDIYLAQGEFPVVKEQEKIKIRNMNNNTWSEGFPFSISLFQDIRGESMCCSMTTLKAVFDVYKGPDIKDLKETGTNNNSNTEDSKSPKKSFCGIL